MATASNNIITLRKSNEKVFDSLKRANRANDVADHKLSPRQKSAIHLNRCLLLMAAAAPGAESLTVAEQLRKEFPDSEFPVLVLAAMHYGEKNFAKCEEVLTVRHRHRQRPSPALCAPLSLVRCLLCPARVSRRTTLKRIRRTACSRN